MNQKGFVNIAIIIGIVVIAGITGYFVLRSPSEPPLPIRESSSEQSLQEKPENNSPQPVNDLRQTSTDGAQQTPPKNQTQNTKEKDVVLIEGQVVVSFSNSVTKDTAVAFLKSLNLSTYEVSLKPTIQFREFSYPSVRLNDLFDYLKNKSIVDECRIIGEYPNEKTVNAECNFRSTVSKDTAVEALRMYPGIGPFTEQPVPPIIYWPDTFFLTPIVVRVPVGKEREWEAKLRTYPEIASASVVPLTQLPVVPQ